MRYYYKNKDNTGFLNLKSPLIDDDYIQITEEEFMELTKTKIPELTAEQKAAQEKAKKIAEYKKYLAETDYIVIKISEALADSDPIAVERLKEYYKEELAQRRKYRGLIDLEQSK